MPKQTKVCRVCGATYEACKSVRSGSKTFNWREVACSPECGMVYLDRITASRSIVEPVEEPEVMRFPLLENYEQKEEQPTETEESPVNEDVEVVIFSAPVKIVEPEDTEVTE